MLQRLHRNDVWTKNFRLKIVSIVIGLNPLSRINSPTLINMTSTFPIVEVLGGIFHFIQLLIEHSASKQWRL